ncbi:hypothetical protein [Desulfatitalea tepidiphila]|uniref:hypothetical protein n=1 Tax=Desulfatitalea tepidiphila TaxID=1185843 RepID=UPI0006B4D635|nr:hypothetical protein [Desulfatitalea tepidiphila]
MLSLPSKPWKKVRIELIGQNLCRLTFLNPIPSVREFEQFLEDLEDVISDNEDIVIRDFGKRYVELRITDYKSFKIRLVFLNISVAQEDV